MLEENMAASTASFVQMLATLCDGVSDIIMGRIVDKTMGRRSGLISAAEHSRALH